MFSLGKSEEGRGKEVDMETVDIFKTATMQETYLVAGWQNQSLWIKIAQGQIFALI